MKRELKRRYAAWVEFGAIDCRAYPDEKGIETKSQMAEEQKIPISDCRAYPDEKGIETSSLLFVRMLGFPLQSLSR